MGIGNIGDLLRQSLSRHGADRGVLAAQVVDAANKQLQEQYGEDILKYVHAHAYQQGEIKYRFTDAVAGADVRMQSKKILQQVQQMVPEAEIKSLVVLPATGQLSP